MEKVEFYKDSFNMEEEESIKKFLLYNSSLVIAGVKPSATVTVSKKLEKIYEKWNECGRDFLESINLSFINSCFLCRKKPAKSSFYTDKVFCAWTYIKMCICWRVFSEFSLKK